jgi:tRNA threonylcarbamoyladenosine biosynthesis protein TsaB
MKQLIIDTSTRRNWVALFDDDHLSGCLSYEDRQSCLINLAPSIQQVLANSAAELRTVGCISAVMGPGAWSSLRIGLATVKQLCLTNQIPLFTISNSQVIADYASLIGCAQPTLLTAIDAGGGKIYSAVYHLQGNNYQAVQADAWQTAAEALRGIDPAAEVAIMGDGASQFEELRPAHWRMIHEYPQADSRYLAQIARQAADHTTFEPDLIRRLKPLYVQPSSAELEFKVQVT